VIGVAIGVTACGSSGGASTNAAGGGASSSSSSSGGTIKIGASISQTGTYAGDGEYALRGYQTAVKEINSNGGLLGKKIQLIVKDDKSDPGTAARLYTKLITQDNVDLLVGPYSSGISEAIIPLAEKFKFPTIFPEASTSSLFKGTQWSVQGIVSSLDYLPSMIDIAKKKGYKTLAEVNQNSPATNTICQGVNAAAKKAGIKVVYQKDYPTDQSDFSSLALGMKKANPDIVLGCAYLPDSIGIAKAIHQQGLTPKMFVESIGPVESDFKKSLGGLANRVISNTAWWPTLTTPGNQKFIQEYKADFNGQEPDYHAAANYASLKVLAGAVKKAGSLDKNKINQILHTQQFPTVVGTYKVNSQGQETGYESYLLQWQHGKLKLVYPPDQAQSKPMLPYKG
jgi:branched-chain amino acid transport system substrate-binding protein